MDAILRDLRYGLRSLVKHPGVTSFAIIALTLGIGATTTMFSIVYGALIKGLPYDNADRILAVQRSMISKRMDRMGMPLGEYYEYRDQQHSFAIFAAETDGTMNVSGSTALPERYQGAWATANFFDVMRVRPLYGRTFTAGEDSPRGAKVVIIGYGLWDRRFGKRADALGQTMRVNGQPFTIVGILPQGYRLPDNCDLWIPIQEDPLAKRHDQQMNVSVYGVLAPGVTTPRADAEMASIGKAMEVKYKEFDEGVTAGAQSFVRAQIGPEPFRLLYAMLFAVFLVLIIACANVANLLLERAAHRSKEVSIRAALGATRAAVVRQFLVEALILSGAGAVLGTIVAYFGIRAFNVYLVDAQPPTWIDIGLHPPVLAFVITIAVLATLFSGALPAVQSSRTDINEVLKDETRGSSSLRIGFMSRALVVAELALSCGLLVASGLMIKSVTNLQRMDPGFRIANLFTARIGFPSGYTDTVAQAHFYDQLRDRLKGLPGVQNATIVSWLPGVGTDDGPTAIEGVAYAALTDLPHIRYNSVAPGFFETFDIRALRGRLLDASDRSDGNPVAVINQAFADKYFPGVDPLGRRIRQGGLQSTLPWRTIVGVVPTTYTGDTDEPHAPAYFLPLAQHHENFVTMVARTAGAPMTLTSSVREIVAQLQPDIPIYRVNSMETMYAQPTWFIRVFGTMFMIFGAIALFLASVGLYAVMSFSVSRRTREVGIRMALGAQGSQVLRLVFRQGLWQIAIGIPLGLGLAFLMASGASVILFDVRPLDLPIYAGVVAVLTAVGIAACLVPARRATLIDPLVALHTD